MSLKPFVRTLGDTRLSVSALGLGLAALGRPAYINLERRRDLGVQRSIVDLEQRCFDVLDQAHALGLRYVDAARSYGLSEVFLGAWLRARGLEPGAITVGSKWGYTYVGEWKQDAAVHEVKDHSLATLGRQFGQSRGYLGDFLRLYQIHSATLESGVLEKGDVLGALAALRQHGLVIGLTVSGPQQADTIRRALDVQIDGVTLFQVVQATWNLLEPSADEALEEARAAGLGVIVKEAMANGRLLDRTDPAARPVLDLAERLDTTADRVAIAAVLAQPWVDVVLSGAVTREQLLSNFQAVALAPQVSLWPSVAEPAAAYWTRRRALAWQ